MTLLEAREALNILSKGRYRSVCYEVNDNSFGDVTVTCTVYAADYSHHSAPTWEEALKAIEYKIYPERKPIVEVEDVPVILA